MTDIDKDVLDHIHNSDELVEFLQSQVLEYGGENEAIDAWSGAEAAQIHSLILLYGLEMESKWYTVPFVYTKYRCLPTLRRKVQAYKRANSPYKSLIGSTLEACICINS